MMYVALAQAAVIALMGWLIVQVVLQAREERRELEDRLLAVCHPVAQTQVVSGRIEPAGEINYVDEEPSSARGDRDAA